MRKLITESGKLKVKRIEQSGCSLYTFHYPLSTFHFQLHLMKGVLICGGTGTRLRPLTEITNKSLLPVYDKPLILYPLQTLIDGGIRDIIIISGNEHIDQMAGFLGSGSRFGCRLSYRVQDKPKGIAQALGLAEEFVDGDAVCAILGDNIFFDDLSPVIRGFTRGGHIFLKEVIDPKRFGVAEIQREEKKLAQERIQKTKKLINQKTHKPKTNKPTNQCIVLSIEEKPSNPQSNLAVTGCYLYDNTCFHFIHDLKPSPRGEFEITDLSARYLRAGTLTATILQDDWVDAGTFESLHKAATLVKERKLH